MVVGTAGTAFIGSIDPLTNIGHISKAHSLWFHVDAAYGGFFILTERGKEAMAGMCYFVVRVRPPREKGKNTFFY